MDSFDERSACVSLISMPQKSQNSFSLMVGLPFSGGPSYYDKLAELSTAVRTLELGEVVLHESPQHRERDRGKYRGLGEIFPPHQQHDFVGRIDHVPIFRGQPIQPPPEWYCMWSPGWSRSSPQTFVSGPL